MLINVNQYKYVKNSCINRKICKHTKLNKKYNEKLSRINKK